MIKDYMPPIDGDLNDMRTFVRNSDGHIHHHRATVMVWALWKQWSADEDSFCRTTAKQLIMPEAMVSRRLAHARLNVSRISAWPIWQQIKRDFEIMNGATK